MEQHTQILIVTIVYLSLLISWGIYQGRKVKTGEDFSIAGSNYLKIYDLCCCRICCHLSNIPYTREREIIDGELH